jgi:predicted metalloprotease
MRWKGERRSGNVDDRRGLAPRGAALGGGALLVVVVVAMLFGADPRELLRQIGGTGLQVPGSGTETGTVATDPAEDELAEFVSVVLAETEDYWREEFRRRGGTYAEPTLVLFRDQVESACGMAGAAMGPFYCPGDRQVYVDLSFYQTLHDRLGAPGDFAQAYVVAHEVGHHVQNLLGVSEQVHAQRGRVSDAEYNALSVRLELQADFYAGLWAHHAARNRRLLEEGDIEEALNAASQIGDDRLQERSQGRVVPDAFTHGTSEQRVRWFRLGFETGDFEQGDTFGARRL